MLSIYASVALYQYYILFPLAIIEGPIITVIAGFLVAQDLMNFYIAFGIIVIADLLGDALYYAMGKWKGQFGLKLLGLSQERLTEIEEHFVENTGKTILLSKVTHGIGGVFLFVAGFAKVPFRKFIYYNAIGTIPKTFILMLIGFFFGNSFVRIGKYFDLFGLVTFGLATILLVAYFRFAKKIRKKEDL